MRTMESKMIHMTASQATAGEGTWFAYCRCGWQSRKDLRDREAARVVGDAHLAVENHDVTPPSVEVLAQWDPDSGGRLRVFLNGTQVDAQVEWVDPGRGYELSTWREHSEHVLLNQGYSPVFRDAVMAARFEAEDSSYIEDDIEWVEVARDADEEPEGYRWRVSYWTGDIAAIADEDVHDVLTGSRAGNDALGAWLIRQGCTNVHLEQWDADTDQGPLNRGWGLYGHLEAEVQP